MSARPSAMLRCLSPVLLLVFMPLAGARADTPVYWLPDAELMNGAFQTEPWGSGYLVSREELPGQGVRFVLTLGSESDSGKTVIGDEWPVAGTAGLGYDEGYYPNDENGPHAQPHDNVSIASWTRYALRVTLHGRFNEISMRLFMNTGMTGPSAYPSSDWRNNAAWLSPVTRIKGGETRVLVLDFDAAEVYSAADNPWPHSGHDEDWTNGTIHAINERDRREITNIGFEVYGAGDSEVTLDVNTPGSPPRLDIDAGTNGCPVALSIDADDARDYRIEWSPDLDQWHTLTNLYILTGTAQCMDPTVPRPPSRYYRAVSPGTGL